MWQSRLLVKSSGLSSIVRLDQRVRRVVDHLLKCTRTFACCFMKLYQAVRVYASRGSICKHKHRVLHQDKGNMIEHGDSAMS